MGAASARQGRTDWLLIWMIGSTALDRLRNESTQVNNSFAKNNLQKQRLVRSLIETAAPARMTTTIMIVYALVSSEWMDAGGRQQRMLCYGLSSTSSLLSVRRRPILPMDEAMLPMRLLVLPASPLRFVDRRDRRCLGDSSLLPSSSSPSAARVRVATTSRAMPPRQNGQVGSGWDCVAGLGLAWQHSASVHAAHIWCPHSRTSMLHACSKQMLHTSASLACTHTQGHAAALVISHPA